MKSLTLALTFPPLPAAGVFGHGYVSDATIGGVTYTGYLPYSDPYYSVPPERIFRKIAAWTCSVAAGSGIGLHWTTWPDSHRGPVLTYMANAVWFKVAHAGKDSDGTWASDIFITNQAYKFKVSASLAAGNYIVRHELVALHSAYSYPGVQFYPSCFQITVTGSGSATGPSSKVAFPGAYTSTSPGIVFDIYQGTGAYPIPGPDVWSG
ncbi:glycoside hydrolase [Choiromyces venosus 120613-1]|uniref:lytic cellulose monooxygenase (C4-dehydrogenating) n=1 Tax=Choiromyces venosus 120613-1 TaxID=1336337 RepID=A0A3N4JLU0_9PEZI|nr:glycoside hydrolase [Choiromyces venosus 120613-1]